MNKLDWLKCNFEQAWCSEGLVCPYCEAEQTVLPTRIGDSKWLCQACAREFEVKWKYLWDVETFKQGGQQR